MITSSLLIEHNKNKKSIHQINTESLAIKIYKLQAGLSPPIMGNLRNFQALESPQKRTVKFGTESISYRQHQI